MYPQVARNSLSVMKKSLGGYRRDKVIKLKVDSGDFTWGLCVCAKSLQSCLTLCDPMDCGLAGSSGSPWDSPSKNTGVGGHFLLQGIFPTQGSNPCL